MAESTMPWTEQPPRLDVAIVGTGRAGAVIGAAFVRAGHRVMACTAVSDLSRLRAESLLPGVAIVPVREAVADRDLVVLAVPDDALADLVQGLATTNAIGPGTFVVHLSGRYGTEVLEPLTAEGALPLALHPVMTFTGTSIDLARLSGCAFGITAPDALRPVAEALVVELGGEPVWVARQFRSLYHAALAFGANGIATLANETVTLLSHAGIDDAATVIAPLLSASLDNALRNSDAATTGPAVRGDARTVAAHLVALAGQHPRTVPAYREVTRLTVARAREARVLRDDVADAVLAELGD